jgi:hypothetical protein
LRALPLLGADRHLVLDLDPRPPAHGAVDHHAQAVDQDKPGAELRAPPDDTAAEDRVETVEQKLERYESPPPRTASADTTPSPACRRSEGL